MSVITDANHKEYERAINMLNGMTKEWAYDIETTGLNVRKDEIIGFGISNGLKGFYFCHQYYENGEMKEGTFTWSTGNKYIGTYRNNMKWNGEMIYVDGNENKKYVNGELVNEFDEPLTLVNAQSRGHFS